jgi:hypothetical protein
MAMLRPARRNGSANLVRLVVSLRSPEVLYYADELPGPETTTVYTRQAPAFGGHPPTVTHPDQDASTKMWTHAAPS